MSRILKKLLVLAPVLGWALLFLHPASPCSAQDAPPAAGSLDTDRWLEIDLYWFNQQQIPASAHAFWDRFQPLFANLRGYKGVILNIGWTVGPIMEWSGNLEQRVTLPKATGQSRWVDERGPLTGTTEERKQKAAARFKHPELVPRHGYDPWAYGDIQRLAAAIKAEAAQRGISQFKVGMLNFAWTNAYGDEAPWVLRHPEAFAAIAAQQAGAFSVGRYFDPGARLHADPAPLGGLPHGIPEGMTVHEAYAAQWGSLSRTLGLDAIMLRDSFGLPVPYERGGPWGPLAPSPEVIRKATQDVAALVRETKRANPQALVMMYSTGASAMADWRSNGLDLETIAREGYLDIFVDQTWAGAWNELGLREGSFWNNPTLGWTYQLAYMLIHSAVLADTKVRHYPLIETFDAWEDWDVIHSAPERLRWGIWAYSHAAVKTPHGLKMPVGSYISWANQGGRLLSKDDVQFLSSNINAAVTDARKTTEVFGPTLVYSREAIEWQAEHATAGHEVGEWLDEQAGSLAKWPVPILSITRMEWLPRVHSDLFVVAAPSHLSAANQTSLMQSIQQGQPVALFGRPGSGIDAGLLRLAGTLVGNASEEGTAGPCHASNLAPELVENAPAAFNTRCIPGSGLQASDARVAYSEDGVPALTLSKTGARRIAVWNPPDLPSTENIPLSQIWGNTGEPYALAAGALTELLKQNSSLHAASIDLRQTMSIAAWRSGDGRVRILAANLEEGLRDDADRSRHTTLVLPSAWAASGWRNSWSSGTLRSNAGLLPIELPQATSRLLVQTQ